MGNQLFHALLIFVSVSSLVSCKDIGQVQKPDPVKVPDDWNPQKPRFEFPNQEGLQSLQKAELEKRFIDADAKVIFQDKDIVSSTAESTCKIGNESHVHKISLDDRKEVPILELISPAVWRRFDLPNRVVCEVEFLVTNQIGSTRRQPIKPIDIRNFQKLEKLIISDIGQNHTAEKNGIRFSTTDMGQVDLLCEYFQNRLVRNSRKTDDALLRDLIDGPRRLDKTEKDSRDGRRLQSCRLAVTSPDDKHNPFKISPLFPVQFREPAVQIITKFSLPYGALGAERRNMDVLTIQIRNNSDSNQAFRLNGLEGQNLKLRLLARSKTLNYYIYDEYTAHLSYSWSGQSYEAMKVGAVVLEVSPKETLTIRAKLQGSKPCWFDSLYLDYYPVDYAPQSSGQVAMDLPAGFVYEFVTDRLLEKFVNWDVPERDDSRATEDLSVFSLFSGSKAPLNGWAPSANFEAQGLARPDGYNWMTEPRCTGNMFR